MTDSEIKLRLDRCFLKNCFEVDSVTSLVNSLVGKFDGEFAYKVQDSSFEQSAVLNKVMGDCLGDYVGRIEIHEIPECNAINAKQLYINKGVSFYMVDRTAVSVEYDVFKASQTVDYPNTNNK